MDLENILGSTIASVFAKSSAETKAPLPDPALSKDWPQRMNRIAESIGGCNQISGQVQIAAPEGSSWTPEVIARLQDGYLSCQSDKALALGDKASSTHVMILQKCEEGQDFFLHRHSQPAYLCWQPSLDGKMNRKLADKIANNCEREVLKGVAGAKEYCANLEDGVRTKEDPSILEEWAKYVGYAVGGAIIFMAVAEAWGKGKETWFDIRKGGGRGGPPSAPSGGGRSIILGPDGKNLQKFEAVAPSDFGSSALKTVGAAALVLGVVAVVVLASPEIVVGGLVAAGARVMAGAALLFDARPPSMLDANEA